MRRTTVPTTPRGRAALFCLALLCAACASFAPGASASTFQSASTCAQCHPEIMRTWQTSQHATAFTDPTFQVPYDRIRRRDPAKARLCEQCHNPVRFQLRPGDPRAAIFAQEGVTCDFCHSVEATRTDGGFPRYTTRPGVKFGPRGGEPGKSVHVTQFSRLHITSDFCAGCHELVNEFGIPILSTVSEWADSFYRGEGVHCQFCHLPQLFDARFIDPARKKGPLDHAMVGGHSRERLSRAIPLRGTLRTTGRKAVVTVTLRNETVGHKTPTGLPSHKIRLESTLYDKAGNAIGRKDEVFERVLGDGAGKPLDAPELIFTAAREVLKDNRLAPKESRRITQEFPLEGAAPATADVALVYELPAPDAEPDLRVIQIPISRIVIPAEPGIGNGTAAAAALVLLVALVATLFFLRLRRRR